MVVAAAEINHLIGRQVFVVAAPHVACVFAPKLAEKKESCGYLLSNGKKADRVTL